MERESNQMQTPPALCRSGCGFYGSPATDGLCSICYKEALKKKQQPPSQSATVVTSGRASPIVSVSSPSSTATAAVSMQSLNMGQPSVPIPSTSEQTKEKDDEVAGAAASVSVDELSEEPSSPLDGENSGIDKDAGDKDKKKKHRCAMCRKKIGLTGFECRCGGLFCAVHRYSDKHNCSFNYRELGAEEIRKNNPVVTGKKIQKI